jgi:hypothetical protein
MAPPGSPTPALTLPPMLWILVCCSTIRSPLVAMSVIGPATLNEPGVRLPLAWVMLKLLKSLPTSLSAARLKARVTVRLPVPVKLLSEPRFSVPKVAPTLPFRKTVPELPSTRAPIVGCLPPSSIVVLP